MKAWVTGLTVVGWSLLSLRASGQYPGSGGQAAPEQSSEDSQDADVSPERLDGDRLRERFPSLQTRAEPRVVQGTLGFTIKVLYLFPGAEATLDLYPERWLRVGLIYAAGMGFKGTPEGAADVVFAQYGEAVAGISVWSKLSKADEDLQLKRSLGNYGEALPTWLRPRRGDFADVVPVKLPSSHRVFVEGGAFTGFTGFQTCAAHCEQYPSQPPSYRDLSRQVVVPFAGFRYVYYSEAIMERPRVNRVHYGQLFGHLLFHAFNEPSETAYFWSGDPVKRSNLGVRFGGVLPMSPLCVAALLGGGCMQAGFTLGYTPYPAFVNLEINARFPIR